MKNLPKFSINRPIAIIMGIMIILILGIISLFNLTSELLPSINFPYAIISTTYPGASPELIENVVTKPIESSMATVSNINDISSISNENYSIVMLEFSENTNLDAISIEMSEKLDMLTGIFPDEVTKPMVIKLNPNMIPIMQFAISFKDKDIIETSNLVKNNILSKLESVPGVAQVQLIGSTEDTINITLNEDKINELNNNYQAIFKQQGLPFTPININSEMIKGILAGQNMEIPVGYINDNNKETLVRIGNGIKSINELKQLPIISNPMMEVIIDDIANVNIKSNEENSYSKVNGEHALIISIQKQSNYATSEVINDINTRIDEIKLEYQTMEINMLLDQAKYINLTINSVLKNLIYGAILAIIVLIFFLKDIRPTIIIGIAIPISVIATFIMIYFYGITLNIVSFGGLALGVGMLVDNAIVVIENIFRLRSDGVSIKDAAKQGAGQVVNAIIAATLTTIAVFLPIIFLEGMIAEIFKQLALTVSFALLSSLIVAMTLVPMMASKMFKTKNKQNIRLMLKTKQLYEKYLNFALKYKFLMIILVLIIFGGSIWGLTKIGTEYIPSGMEDHLMIDLEMPEEITFTEKKELYDQFMNMAMSIEGVETVAISLLKDDINIMGGNNYVFVIKDEESKRTYDEIKADILTETKDDPFIVHIQSEIEMTNMVSSGIEINIIGDDLNTLNEITNNFMNIINNIEGINNVTSNIDDNPSELRIIIDRKASISHGLTNYNVFSTLHDLLNPNYKATDININNRPFKVNVYPSKLNTITEEGLKNIIIDHTPLEDIADIIPSESWNSINRQNQNRYVSIQAEVKEDYNIGLIGEKVQTEIDKYEVPNGYEIILTGENEEINNALNSLIQAALLAVVLIYMVMAIQFESLLYPFIIMFTVPLAWTGSFLALLITGLPLSVVAFIGMIILAGIVVNNGIILVDYINQLKNEGKATKEAVIIAGKTRMRPILMTSLTTILALTVMALDIQKGTAMIRPMAITTIGGLIFATILTLFIIPCIYVIMDNIKLKIKGGN